MHSICPYPGLRPFNEHESIFFKGRDEHIKQIIAQLAKNKFIMITGASGDGKSSLIYAGVIPNARAGFFKAKHNNWIVADFRPERSPLTNLARSLAKQLDCNNEIEVEKQLNYGFSSLINLYKESPYYLDTNTESFHKLHRAEQQQQRRRAANLLILADQFEEFFTNVENFSNEQPSVEAQTAVNLLIETSKIALENDIPVYVVCTMRSDYIGQCASFRGLAQLIGFSQFFVPRLRRKEIQQVIVEPAILNGNKISNRLTQTLINELGEGFDQLPVLQHALNQIWKAADNGKQEMDLLHLVKVAGLSANYLSEGDKADFEAWFATIPDFKKKFFQNPSLENVLNAHANELFETAHEFYNRSHEATITRETAQFIIKKSFQSLTKSNGDRAVRSRMTLQEITDVIYRTDINYQQVGGVLDIFRMPGNTFLHPFISSEDEYSPLKSTDVLDITHESLIRNWQMLLDWTNEEYQNIITFHDFEKQTQRWIGSRRSSDYLLPIGPLTYFEGWFLKLDPNKYWLQKYDETNAAEEAKLKAAETKISQGREFIKRSARKLFLTRTVMKYGAARIAACFTAIILIGLGTYLFFDYRSKQNENVLPKLEARCFTYLNNKSVTNIEKANFLVNEEILHPGSLQKNLQRLNSDTLRMDVSMAIVQKHLAAIDRQDTVPDFALHVFSDLCKDVDSYVTKDTSSFSESKVARITRFLNNLDYLSIKQTDIYSSSGAKPVANHIAESIYKKYVVKMIGDTINKDIDGSILLNSVRLYMLQNRTDTANFRKMIQNISPFEGPAGKERFAILFPKSITIQVSSYGGNEITHKGGYLLLSYLYSGVGDNENVSRCIDSLYFQNPKFALSNYDNFSSIVNFFFTLNNFNDTILDRLVNRYAKVSSLEKSTITYNLTNKSTLNLDYSYIYYYDFEQSTSYITVNYQLPRACFNGLWNYYYKILTGTSINDNNGGLSITSEDKLLQVANYYKIRGLKTEMVYSDSIEAINNFNKFSEAYDKMSENFLDTEQIFKVRGTVIKKKNSFLLLYPDDILYGISVLGYDQSSYLYLGVQGTLFEKFIIHHGLDRFFKGENNELLLRVLYSSYPFYSVDEYTSIEPIANRTKFFYEFFDSVNAFVLRTNNAVIKDDGILDLYNIEKRFRGNENEAAMAMLNSWGVEKMLKCFKRNQADFKSQVDKSLIKRFSTYMAINQRSKESFEIITALNKPEEKRDALIANSLALLYKDKKSDCFIYLDSLLNMIKDDDKFGLALLKTLGRIDERRYSERAVDLIGRLGETKKNDALTDYVIGISEANKYYAANNTIPNFLPRDREFKILNCIIGTHICHEMLEKRMDKKYLNAVDVSPSLRGWGSYDFESDTYYYFD